ncbi:MAG TPA: ATP-binding protein [Blastocatellia bacterium]|nr:ATP-binding protein [Blastocatellia bacterium]
MTKRVRPQNVRIRLTLWYVVVLAGALLVYGVSTSALLVFQLRGQLDHRAIEDLETIKGLLSFGSNGKVFFRSDDGDHSYPTKMQDPLIEVLAEDGTLIYRNELLGNRSLGGPPEPGEMSGSYSERSIRLSDGMPVRLVSKRYTLEGHPTMVRLGLSEEELWRHLWQVVAGLLAGLPLVLILAGGGGYFLARHALSPIERMARRAHEINADRLSARLDVENPRDELGLLAMAFNNTFSRLECSFEQLRRFTSDAAHELRTPLTAIRSVGEVALQKRGGLDHYREAIGSMLEEVDRLSRLVNSLLMIARADSAQIQLHRTNVPVLSFVLETASVLEVLAEEKGQSLLIEGDDGVQVQADPVILRQVLISLLDNAIKYSCIGGSISVRVLCASKQNIAIEVEDSGPGIAAEHRDKIFDRFYRVDEGRSREAGGTGLGLAIAKWGADAHGGHLELDCPAPGGCVFRLLLPASAVPSDESRAGSSSVPNVIHQ